VGGIEFVEVKSGRFPVFMHAEGEVEIGLAREPGGVRANFRGAEVLIVAVEVEAVGVFAGGAEKAGRVEQRTEEPHGAVVEAPGFEQREEGEGRGGFVAVDTGGKIDAGAGAGPGRAFGEGEQGRAGEIAKAFDTETGGRRGGLEAGRKGQGIEGRGRNRRERIHGGG
jgi:hypothetical protein